MIDEPIVNDLATPTDEGTYVAESEMLAGTTERQRIGRLLRFQCRMKLASQCMVDEALRVLKFFFALRCAFVNLRCFSFCCDASRDVLLSRMIGFVARPNNIGGFLQPVATIEI